MSDTAFLTPRVNASMMEHFVGSEVRFVGRVVSVRQHMLSISVTHSAVRMEQVLSSCPQIKSRSLCRAALAMCGITLLTLKSLEN